MEDCTAEIVSSLIRASTKSGIAAHRTKLSIEKTIVTENSFGGILLENCQVRISGNNILNNGKWEIKVLDNNRRVQAARIWWCHNNPNQNKIIGPVAIQPILSTPIEFKILD